MEYSLNNSVPGQTTDKVRLRVGHSFRKKKFPKQKFCPNVSLDTKIWSVHKHAKFSSPKSENSRWTTFTTKTFSVKSFSSLCEMEFWQTADKKYAKCPKHFSSEPKIFVRIIFLSKKIFFFSKPSKCPKVPKVFVIMKVLFQRKPFTRKFFQICRLQFRQPWRKN